MEWITVLLTIVGCFIGSCLANLFLLWKNKPKDESSESLPPCDVCGKSQKGHWSLIDREGMKPNFMIHWECLIKIYKFTAAEMEKSEITPLKDK